LNIEINTSQPLKQIPFQRTVEFQEISKTLVPVVVIIGILFGAYAMKVVSYKIVAYIRKKVAVMSSELLISRKFYGRIHVLWGSIVKCIHL
jgi:hypothetical protein